MPMYWTFISTVDIKIGEFDFLQSVRVTLEQLNNHPLIVQYSHHEKATSTELQAELKNNKINLTDTIRERSRQLQ